MSLSAYLNANNLDTTLNANANRNIAAAMAQAASKKVESAIPEDASLQFANDLPPTIKLLVFLWDEIKSYCIQAILQQMIVASPLGKKKKHALKNMTSPLISVITPKKGSFSVKSHNFKQDKKEAVLKKCDQFAASI